LSDIKVCGCGCGQPTRLATKTRHAVGHRRGEPLRFLNGHGATAPDHSDAEAATRAASLDPEFGHWLAGFADGEGSFQISKSGSGARYCKFVIALHADDAAILYETAARTGLGLVRIEQSPAMKSPRAAWRVARKAHLEALIGIFEKYPLRAKKRTDFEIWKLAVAAVRQGQHELFDQLRLQLRASRRPRGPKAVYD
jgi:hypothetical protein